MHHFFILTVLFLLPNLSIASEIVDFRCITDSVIEENVPTQIMFKVKNLGKESVTYVDESEDDSPVTMIPADSKLMLNDNWGIDMKDGNLVMSSDGDGCQFTTFVLYKDSDFKKGFVRVKDGGCGVTPVYSKVTCSVR